MLRPPPSWNQQWNVVNGENYVQSVKPDTHPSDHGAVVTDIASSFAPGGTLKPYRVVRDLSKIRKKQKLIPNGKILNALQDAASDNTDLVNLSIGVLHDNEPGRTCGGYCPFALDIKNIVTSNELPLVVAAGNAGQDDPKDIHCPAMLNQTIAVGGMISVCRKDPIDTKSAGHCWTRPNPADPYNIRGPLCGQRGCGNGASCDDHCFEYQWSGNVSFRHTTPDILAPVHYPVEMTNQPGANFRGGTSYAAPIVTALLGEIISELNQQGTTVSPTRLRQAIQNSGSPIPDGSVRKFDHRGTRDQMGL